MTWNATGMLSSCSYIVDILTYKNIDILGISEHWLRETDLHFLDQLHSNYYYKSFSVCDRDLCFSTAAGNKKSKSKSAAKFEKRAGAKAVKTFERHAAGAGGVLNRQAATTYRAVSARANYLAADRADGSSWSAWGVIMSVDPSWHTNMTSVTNPLPSSTLIATQNSQDVGSRDAPPVVVAA